MKYHIEQIQRSEWSVEYRVVDENNVQVESFWTPEQAQWKAEDLNAGKKALANEEAFVLTNALLGEVEEKHEIGTTVPSEEEVVPVPSKHTEVRVSGKHKVGSIVAYRGENWLVTHCEHENGIEPEYIRDEMDEVPPVGWYSWLFRVGNNKEAMQVIVEQHNAGQAEFTSPTTVLFTGEQYASDIRDLVYTPEIGVYDRTRVGAPIGNKNAVKDGLHRIGFTISFSNERIEKAAQILAPQGEAITTDALRKLTYSAIDAYLDASPE